MILYVENPKDSTKKMFKTELINEFNSCKGEEKRKSTQKSVDLPYTNNEQSEKEINTIPFTKASKRIILRNLIKEKKDLYTENYKTLLKEIKDK